MKQMVEMKFKNKTEQEMQFNTYKKSQRGMKVFGDVGPYYLTWGLLSIYRIDRGLSYNILLILIAIIFAFEVQVRLKYGTGQYEYFFSLLNYYFPKNFTIGENLKLTRELFPLIF